MIVQDILKEMQINLEASGSASPRLDAEVMLACVLKTETWRLMVDNLRELSPAELRRAHSYMRRRLEGEPVAYITGVKEFYALEFSVGPDVLIPRPETELLVDLVIYYARQGARILDLGTGSGAIALSIKHTRPDVEVYASDVSAAALRIARKNARLILKNNSVRFYQGDLFAPFTGRRFDIIVSNPPYIDPAEKPLLQREIHFEPERALYAGEHGRDVIARLVHDGADYLNDNGMLIFEIAQGQKDLASGLAHESGFTVSVLNDYAGQPRVAVLKIEK